MPGRDTAANGLVLRCDFGRGRVTKNSSKGTLTVQLLDTGKTVTRQAKSFRQCG